MANILSAEEGSNVLRCAVNDAEMLALLPLVDAYIKNASGRDWTADSTIHPEAKSAARMLLVRWHEDPGGMAAGSALGFGLAAVLTQLEALALRYFTFEGISGGGYILLPGVHAGDTVEGVMGKVGDTGDQSAAFETVISLSGYIKQLSTADLADHWYTAYIVPPEAL